MRRRPLCAIPIALCVVSFVACSREPAATPEPTSAPAVAPTRTVAPTPTRTPVPTRDPAAFDVDKALAHIRKLVVNIGIREAGSVGDVAAGDYLRAEIERLGWRGSFQTFPLPKGGTSRNVIGTPKGFSLSKPYLIVGGHYDSLRGPGANDNGTGIGVSLEIARALAAKAAPLPVVFVAFGAEERETDPQRSHHVGSRAYVDAMTNVARKNLVAMVNVDMVGWGTYIHCPRMTVGPREGADRCVRIGRSLGIDARPEVRPKNESDHGTFALAGMNYAWLWAGEDFCCYHSPRDTMARVKRDELDRAGRVALAILRSYTAPSR